MFTVFLKCNKLEKKWLKEKIKIKKLIFVFLGKIFSLSFYLVYHLFISLALGNMESAQSDFSVCCYFRRTGIA